MCNVKMIVTQSCLTLCNPVDCSSVGPSVEFSRQEYWRGLPCPSPGYLPDPGIELTSPRSRALAGRFFITSATWEAPCEDKVVISCSFLDYGLGSNPGPAPYRGKSPKLSCLSPPLPTHL